MRLYNIVGTAERGSVIDSFNIVVTTKDKMFADELIQRKYEGWKLNYNIKYVLGKKHIIHVEKIEVLSK